MSTTNSYTLSLHDALPILRSQPIENDRQTALWIKRSMMPKRAVTLVVILLSLGMIYYFEEVYKPAVERRIDRKSTRLNSSHRCISYAVFCLKKKKKTNNNK